MAKSEPISELMRGSVVKVDMVSPLGQSKPEKAVEATVEEHYTHKTGVLKGEISNLIRVRLPGGKTQDISIVRVVG